MPFTLTDLLGTSASITFVLRPMPTTFSEILGSEGALQKSPGTGPCAKRRSIIPSILRRAKASPNSASRSVVNCKSAWYGKNSEYGAPEPSLNVVSAVDNKCLCPVVVSKRCRTSVSQGTLLFAVLRNLPALPSVRVV